MMENKAVETGLLDRFIKKENGDIFVRIYVLFMFGLYPLIFNNYYFDIVTVKYKVYVIVTALMLAISARCIDKDTFSKIKSKKIRFSGTDKCIIVFLFANVISTILSDTPKYALNGANGRNMGLISVILMAMTYFAISRLFLADRAFDYFVAIGSILISFLGITNAFNIDLLGFYDGLSYGQKISYISTLGHVDIYTTYFAISIPLMFMAYLEAENVVDNIIFFIVLEVNLLGVMAGHCESAYIIVAIGFLSVIAFGNKGYKFAKCILPILMWLIICRYSVKMNDDLKEPRIISGIGKYLFSKEVYSLCIISLSMLIVISIAKEIDTEVIKIIIEFGLVFIPVVIFVILVFFNFLNKDISFYGIENVFRISASTGNYRGYIWKLVIKEYADFDMFNKLYGIGTDSLKPYVVSKFGNEMYRVTNAYYDNAHNEALQYLFTTGILGLAAYIGILWTSIKNALNNENRKYIAVIVTYLFQSMVNINQVITTPLFFIIIAMLASLSGRPHDNGRGKLSCKNCLIGNSIDATAGRAPRQ